MCISKEFFPEKYKYAKPEFRKNIDGLIMIRGNGSSRYLTLFETAMYKWFGFMPRDCISHKDTKANHMNWNVLD